MRIVGGSLRGRRFQAPKKIDARPTTDYAKESLFNILNNRVNWSESHFLDLYSGIANISLEAISRGALSVTSVDISFDSIKWHKKLQADLNLKGSWNIEKNDVLRWLKSSNKSFDLVFADPPYDYPHYDELISLIMSQSLRTEGLLILEHRKSGSFEDHPNFESERKYGEVKFSFFQNTK